MLHDFENGLFITKTETINLTITENILLDELLNNKNSIIIYKKFIDRLKEISATYEFNDVISRNAVRRNVSSLRKKMRKYIKINNRRGFGYCVL